MSYPRVVPVRTLTKADLVKLLDGIADDTQIYICLTRSVLAMAEQGALDKQQDLYFGVSSSSTHQPPNGISLLADIK